MQYLRTFDDAVRLRGALLPGTQLVVIGAGFIGLELAASARVLGAEVTVIESQPRILMRGVPGELAARLHARHVEGGVRLHIGTAISGIEPGAVVLADGGHITADLIVAGIGATPNTELAAAAGLAIENGVLVDEGFRTSAPDVFAAGDCCNAHSPLYGRRVRLESWRSAQDQGTTAARNMLGSNETWTAVPWFWSDQYDLTLQVAGLADGATATVRREIENGTILFHLDGDGRLLAASGLGVGNAVARDIRVAQMLIGRVARPDVAALAAPGVKLKSLLAA